MWAYVRQRGFTMSTDHNKEEVTEEKTLTQNNLVYLVMEMPDTGKYEITCVGIHCVA